MLQQVTITSSGPVEIKPLLETAIRSQLKMLQHGIRRTKERLAEFELQYHMTSKEFEQQFSKRNLEESLDFIEWWGEIQTLQLLEDQQNSLESARVE